MPSLSELPDNINRTKFLLALVSLGFEIRRKGGKGSHIKAIWSKTGKFIIVQNDFRRDVLYHCIKDIERISSVTWEDLKRELHIN